MIEKLLTRCRQVAGLILAVCFTVSMFMCGDANCLAGDSNEDCASLLCSLLSKHNNASQNPSGDAAKECSCVCHLPTILTPALGFDFHPISHSHNLITSLRLPAAPNRLVYHPPATA
jgi:hypothetical protein